MFICDGCLPFCHICRRRSQTEIPGISALVRIFHLLINQTESSAEKRVDLLAPHPDQRPATSLRRRPAPQISACLLNRRAMENPFDTDGVPPGSHATRRSILRQGRIREEGCAPSLPSGTEFFAFPSCGHRLPWTVVLGPEGFRQAHKSHTEALLAFDQ